MRRFYVEVDETINIKPDTLLLTTSITYSVLQATREKNVKNLLVFRSYRPIQKGLPKNLRLLKISISREQHYANHTNRDLK